MAFSRRNFLFSSLALAVARPQCSWASASTVENSVDVLIVGASLGGVAAALAAARLGATVALTEQTSWIGGQATTQGVPLDEHPWIESFGRTQSYATFRDTVRQYYRQNYPLSGPAQSDPHFNPGACWVSACGFEPRVGLAALYEMLAPFLSSSQIALYTQTVPQSVDISGDIVRAVSFRHAENGGLLTLHARYILDATDLGDLLPLAGVEFVTGAESRSDTQEPSAIAGPAQPLMMQGFTHLIAVDHLPGEDHTIAKPAAYAELRPQFKSLMGTVAAQGDELKLRGRRLFAPASAQYASSIWNFRRILCASNFAPGAFPSDVTMLMNGNECDGRPLVSVPEESIRKNLEYGRELSLALLYFFQTEVEPGLHGRPGFPGLRARGDVFDTLDGLAQYPYIRESRRIKAEFTVLEQHFRIDQRPAGPLQYTDTIGLSGYRMDIHEHGTTHQSLTQQLNGKHWVQQIPLGALLPVRVENLLPACKNLGTTRVTNGAFRVHPAEWNIGEAAGALAAFCVQTRIRPRQVRAQPAHLADFQSRLRSLGVELEWPRPLVAASYNALYANVPNWYFGEASLRYRPSGQLR